MSSLDSRTVSWSDKIKCVTLLGAIDSNNIKSLSDTFRSLSSEGMRMAAVDLSAVDAVGSAGVGYFLELARSGIRLILVGIQPQIKMLLTVAGIDQSFEYADNLEGAKSTLDKAEQQAGK